MSGWDKAVKRIRQNVAEEVERFAIDTQREMKVKLSQPGSGRAYKRPDRIHIASAPGEPPAIDNGNLVRSIQVDSSRVASALVARVGTNVVYARALEFGLPRRNLEARPYMRPTLNVMRKQVDKRFSVKRILRGVGI